jgi:hypothetical protein
MHYSAPTLHAPVLTLQSHKDLLGGELLSIVTKRRPAPLSRIAAPAALLDIPLTTVSLDKNFDAYINISFRGAPANFSVPLVVDSGNFSLIVPDYEDIAGLANFSRDYAVVATNVIEPWGCPASILQGPIEIPTQDGSVYEISNCLFYACTGANPAGDRTANFGTGCISPWYQQGNVTIKSPLSFDATYPYAEFNYAAANQIFAVGTQPNIAQGSSLTLYRAMPQGYQTFDIIKNLMWMSLIPRSLSVGGIETAWPGTVASPPIAMVDTGGGPVFLSDPNGYLYKANWPDPVPPPWWTSPGSVSCESTKDDIAIGLGDDRNSFSYRIDTSALPASVQGLTLVMCEMCEYMMGNQGMNIGGISALFNKILIDYVSGKVGFKAKMAAVI